MGSSPLLLVILLCIILAALRKITWSPSRPRNFPPGPPRLPFLGNLHQVLRVPKAYTRLAELSRSYGTHGVMGLKLGPTTNVLVINERKAVEALLEKRGAIYSSRPPFLGSEYVHPSAEVHLAMMSYGKKWHRMRKTLTIEFVTRAQIQKRTPLVEAESTQLMMELLREPGNFHNHVLRYHGAIIMASVFGIRGKSMDEDSLMGRFFSIHHLWSEMLEPGSIPPYDIFPFLKYVPNVLLGPWRNWKGYVRYVGRIQRELYSDLLNEVKSRITEGRGPDCLIAKLLCSEEKEAYSVTDLQYIGGVLLEGGSDTTANAFKTFLHAMAAFPQVLKRAQAEVDQVFGDKQMPTGTDAARLPYLMACILEVLRWRPGVAAGIPHATTKDDTYEGYVSGILPLMHINAMMSRLTRILSQFIPAGTTVLMNIWGINHDPEVYTNPEAFEPERFMRYPAGGDISDVKHDKNTETPKEYSRRLSTFGAGRRVCIGQYMALDNMLLAAAKVIWGVNIQADGPLDMSLGGGFGNGISSSPKPCKINFNPRDEQRKELMEKSWEEHDNYLKQFE
ncbi:cytochrome P450 [Xylaria telfairii]|nr:cytochrome P450 [Xylaria telfairii]